MRFQRFLLQDYNIFIQGSVRYVLLIGFKSVEVKYSLRQGVKINEPTTGILYYLLVIERPTGV